MHETLDDVCAQVVGIAGLAGGKLHGHTSFGFASKLSVDIHEIFSRDPRTEIYYGFLFHNMLV